MLGPVEKQAGSPGGKGAVSDSSPAGGCLHRAGGGEVGSRVALRERVSQAEEVAS